MEQELNSALIILEVFGLQYFSLKTLSPKTLRARPSPVRTFYLIVLLVVMTATATWFIFNEAVLDTGVTVTAKNVLTFAIQHSLNCGFILIIIISLVQSYVATPKMKKVYLNLKEISDIALDQFNIKKDFKIIKKNAIRRLRIVTVVFLTLHLSVFFLRSVPRREIVPMLIGMIPVYYMIIIAYKFVSYVAMVNSQMSFVNRLIEEAFKRPPIPIKTVETIKITLINPQPVKKYDNPTTKLLHVRRIFNLVYENGTLINGSNGLTILIMLVDMVIAITASGYEVFMMIIGGLPIDKMPGEIISWELLISIFFLRYFVCHQRFNRDSAVDRILLSGDSRNGEFSFEHVGIFLESLLLQTDFANSRYNRQYRMQTL
jgi:hypothetical protein